MRRFTPLAAVFVLLAFASMSRAELTHVVCANDGDGAINCALTGWGAVDGEYVMGIAGTQSGVTGHMEGAFTTNTAIPSTIKIKVTNGIENGSPDVWTDYHIKVAMDHPFTLLTPFVTEPTGWTIPAITQPTLQTTGLYIGKYLGEIDYVSGTPVAIGEFLELGYKLSFPSTMNYSYCQEMTYSVPEPSTIAMLLPGLLVGGLALRRKR